MLSETRLPADEPLSGLTAAPVHRPRPSWPSWPGVSPSGSWTQPSWCSSRPCPCLPSCLLSDHPQRRSVPFCHIGVTWVGRSPVAVRIGSGSGSNPGVHVQRIPSYAVWQISRTAPLENTVDSMRCTCPACGPSNSGIPTPIASGMTVTSSVSITPATGPSVITLPPPNTHNRYDCEPWLVHAYGCLPSPESACGSPIR